MDDIIELDRKYITATYARLPLHIVSGSGSVAVGADGREYIDMGAGIAVNSFGISDKEWVAAVTEQLGKVQHTSNLYYTEPCVRLAGMLCERTGMDKVFFCNSGAEANECAIKAARKYAAEHKGEEYYNIITLKNSFHGRTVTTLAATGQDEYHTMFKPLTDGFVYAEPNDIEDVRRKLDANKTAAIMFEVVQGEGGVNALSFDFVSGLRDLAREYEVLLIADEVQTGNGRTGKLYGYMNYDVEPDIVTTAKGLAGGLPIGAVMFSRNVSGVYTPGTHGSTFGGNPVCCAGAVNILSRIDESLLEQVRQKSDFIRSAFEGARGVRSVSGLGLMLGLDVEKDAKSVASECLDRGVLVLTAKNKVRLLPALNIPMDLLGRAVDIIKEVCAQS